MFRAPTFPRFMSASKIPKVSELNHVNSRNFKLWKLQNSHMSNSLKSELSKHAFQKMVRACQSYKFPDA